MSRAPIRTTARPGVIHVSSKAYAFDWARLARLVLLAAAATAVLVVLVGCAPDRGQVSEPPPEPEAPAALTCEELGRLRDETVRDARYDAPEARKSRALYVLALQRVLRDEGCLPGP